MSERTWSKWAWNKVPAMPTITKEVEIPVYMIHRPGDAEDYFFLFDFEDFMERSASGLFVRPKLRIWAGRDDFDRRSFARQFREVFAQEFDEMRRAARPKDKSKGIGWLGFVNSGIDGATGAVVDIVGTLVLYLAVAGGQALKSILMPSNWLKKKKTTGELEAEINETKARVDQALERIDVSLHRELYVQAYRGQPPGRLTGMEYDAWPLPDYVRTHIDDGRSGSWW